PSNGSRSRAPPQLARSSPSADSSQPASQAQSASKAPPSGHHGGSSLPCQLPTAHTPPASDSATPASSTCASATPTATAQSDRSACDSATPTRERRVRQRPTSRRALAALQAARAELEAATDEHFHRAAPQSIADVRACERDIRRRQKRRMGSPRPSP